MNIGEWLKQVVSQLKTESPTPALDSEVLLADLLGKDRAWVLAHPEYVLDTKALGTLDKQVQRRAAHEPLAYIRGKSEFYGREFMVSPHTLQPRPETETMIDMFLKRNHKGRVADIGTGSGAIAITIKLQCPELDVYATEISPEAIDIAKKNSIMLGANVRFLQGNLLDPLVSRPDVLLCNLPYVPDAQTINEAAMQEPKTAIFGGKDGLDLYRELFAQTTPDTRFIYTESLPTQHNELAAIAKKYGYTQAAEDDFIQLFERL